MQPLLTERLNLPGVEVENYTDLGGQFILEVEAKGCLPNLLYFVKIKHDYFEAVNAR